LAADFSALIAQSYKLKRKKLIFPAFFLVHAFLTAKNKTADVVQNYTCHLEV